MVPPARASVAEMLQFCEDESLCRRQQLVEFFGQKFPRAECGDTCDNCRRRERVEQRRVVDEARAAVRIVEALQRNNYESPQALTTVLAIFRGSGAKKVERFRRLRSGATHAPLFGIGKHITKESALRLFNVLLIGGYLEETAVTNGMGYESNVLSLGRADARAALAADNVHIVRHRVVGD